MNSQLRNKKAIYTKNLVVLPEHAILKEKGEGIQMMKIAIFYQKESKLLDDIRKKIRKETCQPDNIYAIYEYSTIEALRKANEQSPMDIVFLEDTIDNCGLTAAKYIRETGQKLLSTFSERLRIGLLWI